MKMKNFEIEKFSEKSSFFIFHTFSYMKKKNEKIENFSISKIFDDDLLKDLTLRQINLFGQDFFLYPCRISLRSRLNRLERPKMHSEKEKRKMSKLRSK